MTEIITDIRNNIIKKDSDRTIDRVLFNGKRSTKTENFTKNMPVAKLQNTPLEILGQCDNYSLKEYRPNRCYTKAKSIETLALYKYRQNGRGISFNDLLLKGLAKHKKQAQTKLKYCLRASILFTPYSCKPQLYYPSCIRSEISNRIIPVRPIGVGRSRPPLLQGNHMDNRSINIDHGKDLQIEKLLEGYVLPLLPTVPMHIHKLHFKTKITPECYREIVLPASPWNKGKEHEEIIGSNRARYRFYANGTVVVSTESSNNPFRLDTESDCSCFMAFLGQLRDRLVLFLADKHERIVPEIMTWELTQCDINKDVRIERWLQPTGLSIQVRHLSHLFRVYIKSTGGYTACRVEESITPKGKPVIEAINNIFNPTERLENQIVELNRKFDRFFYGTGIIGKKDPKTVGNDYNVFGDNDVIINNTRRTSDN